MHGGSGVPGRAEAVNLARGGEPRAGKDASRAHAGPNPIYITLYGRRWQDLGGDLYVEVSNFWLTGSQRTIVGMVHPKNDVRAYDHD